MRFIRKIFGSIIVLMIFTAMTSFGNSHNVSAISGSQILAGTAYTTLDPFGVEQFFPQKAGKQQLVMGYDDPNSILGFGLDG